MFCARFSSLSSQEYPADFFRGQILLKSARGLDGYVIPPLARSKNKTKVRTERQRQHEIELLSRSLARSLVRARALSLCVCVRKDLEFELSLLGQRVFLHEPVH